MATFSLSPMPQCQNNHSVSMLQNKHNKNQLMSAKCNTTYSFLGCMGVSWGVSWRVNGVSYWVSSFTCQSLSNPCPRRPWGAESKKLSKCFMEKRCWDPVWNISVKGSSPASAGDVLTCGDCRLVAFYKSPSFHYNFHSHVTIESSSSHHHISFISSSHHPYVIIVASHVIIISSSCHYHIIIISPWPRWSTSDDNHHIDQKSFKIFSQRYFLKRICHSRQKFPLLEIVKYIQHKVAHLHFHHH